MAENFSGGQAQAPAPARSPDNTELQADEFLVDPNEASDTEMTHTEIKEEEDDHNKAVTSKKRSLAEPPVQEDGQSKKAKVEEKETEDVCFICHDGGELHLCGKRDCPKVYHSACVGSEEVFKEEGTWYCGWHYCVECNKVARYHCVTCTNAYCAAHSRTSEFTVLKKKEKLGLCQVCMPEVQAIESGDLNELGDSEVGGRERFFRDYWLDQRAKLDLALPPREEPAGGQQLRSSAQAATGGAAEVDEEGSADHEDLGAEDDSSDAAGPPLERRKFASWASPELLAFLASCGHDVSKALRKDAVSSLVWEYIHEKQLLNPKKKTEVLCDEALERLFKRKAVGRLEMNRILQEQFSGSHTARGASGRRLGKTTQQNGKGGGKARKVTQAGAKQLNRSESSKKKKAVDTKGPTETPAAEAYVAISRKNIELLYLRRGLLESLVDSPDFERAVLGGFVRIRTQAIDNPNKAAYRLVPVIGVAEGPEYTFGRKTTTCRLTVQNLSKVEDSLMDSLSSQDFDDDELARLWRATKVAEVFKPMTVGQVEAKARELLPFRVDEAMEAEKQKLINLRDRASELGEMKELKRIVEQLKELDKPETRQVRLDAPLDIEVDPRMDPDFVYDPEAEEKEKKEKDAQHAAEQQKVAPPPGPSPRDRRDDRSSRWGARGADNRAQNDSRTDREKPREAPPDKRRPFERPQERPRDRSRERERGRRSPYQGRGGGGGLRDREPDRGRLSPRGEDRRKEERRGGRFSERPRESRFDEPPRGMDLRPGVSPRFGGERPRSRERGPSNDRPGFDRGVREERAPPLVTGFSGPPLGESRGGLSPRGVPGRGFLRDARDPPLQLRDARDPIIITPPGHVNPPLSFHARPPPQFGGLNGVPNKNRQQFAGSFDDRPPGNRMEYGKYEAPRKFEPPPVAPPQQNRPPPLHASQHADTYRSYGDRSGIRPQFRSGQPPPIAPLPVPVTVPVTVPPPAVVPVPYAPPADPKWHYRDPQGVQQGPFTLAQLKKWQATGAFPAELKVWMEDRPESSALLLTSLLDAQSGRSLQPSSGQGQVAGTYQPQAQVETQRTTTPPAIQERAEATRFGGTSRWEPAGGVRATPQAVYGGSARMGDNVSNAQGYQGDVLARDGGGVISGAFAPRQSERGNFPPSQNDGGRAPHLPSGNYGRVIDGRGPPSNFVRGHEGDDRWKGNPVPRAEGGHEQFDAATRRIPASGPGANTMQHFSGQGPSGGPARRQFEGHTERPQNGQGPPGDAQQRPKVNKPCMYFAKGYCVKGDSCDFVHQR